MRLYLALHVTAVMLLTSNVHAGAADCAMTPDDAVDSSGSATPDSFYGFDTSRDSPLQPTGPDVGDNEDSTSSSDDHTTETLPDSLMQKEPTINAQVIQDSPPTSDIEADKVVPVSETPHSKQGIIIPDESDASSRNLVANADVAGDAKTRLQRPAVSTSASAITPNTATSRLGNARSKPVTPPRSSTTSSKPKTNSSFCTKPRVVISNIDVGVPIDSNEDEVALKVVAIAAMPSGGSRIAFHSGGNVIVRELDASDKLVTSKAAIKVPMHDFADIHADGNGFVILGTRDAKGGGTLNCGNPRNLCGSAPSPAVPCFDMYLARYEGASEKWATKLTSSSASLPPYSTSKTGKDVYMIWWYAHHGRLAFDGNNWAAYFGAAVSTSQNGCINIHQGDRMKVVSPSGAITADQDSFDWGCSHSAYERITFDNRTSSYATICKTDNNNRIMPPKDWTTTIYPVDLGAANLGDIVPDADPSSQKYWATVSNGSGDTAKVHLIHFAMDAAASQDITLGGTQANERAPHLASIGKGGLLAMWEGSSTGGDLVEGSDRTVYAQVLDATTGKAVSEKVTLDKSVVGNRYQALKTYPDGSVAYLSKGKTSTSVQVVRFFGC